MAKEEKKKQVVDYHKLNIELLSQLVQYVNEEGLNPKNDEGKLKFNPSDYVQERAAATKLVDVLNADGKPKYYVGKDGKTKIRKQKIAVGSAKEKYFNLMKAKVDFYAAFKNDFEWINLPKAANKKNEESKVKDALAAMGVTL